MKRYPKNKLIKFYRENTVVHHIDGDRDGGYEVSIPLDYTQYDNIQQDETRDITILGFNCKINKYEKEVGSDESIGEMCITVSYNGSVIGVDHTNPRIAIQEAFEHLKHHEDRNRIERNHKKSDNM